MTNGKGLKILALHANSGSRFYRINPQLKWMQAQGHQVRLERHDVAALDQFIAWADVVILQMVFSRELIDRIHAAGKKVVFECDDLMHKTHAKHYSYSETDTLWKQIKWYWRVWKVIHAADGFVVSTPELRKIYGWMNRKTLVFGNYLDLPHWLKEAPRNTTDRIRILWAGSTSHTGDLHWVKPIMAEIMRRYPKVQFIYMGHGGVPTDDLYARFVYGEDIFEGLPKNQRESLLPAPPNVYPYVLAAVEADIAIAPLEKNYFNRFKTQCKYLEYAINGIPGVYSKWFYTDVKSVPAPAPLIPTGKGDWTIKGEATGILADSTDEWIGAISLLVDNATLRKQIGENAREVAIRDYDFAKHAARWQGFVEMIAQWPSRLSMS